ncbi:MAG: FAD-dependent oxidoreductase, partial [Acidobacteriales bacterium]|nr:FAD-dependent oxidoreductase [Terriglobales bacterium]
MTYDLAVIGGGPAGCAAAIRSARAGARVVLLERGTFPRHKVCGEFVSAESLELLGELLVLEYRQLVSDSPRISRGRIFADGREVAAEINPAAASITRFEMDSALWTSCIQNGVETRENCTVQTVSGAEVFTIKTTAEEFKCKAVINATGRWSNLTGPATRSRLAKQRWIGIKAHFSEPDAPLSVDLYFFNGGYCGIQPIATIDNGAATRTNACAMVRADVATTLAEVLRC